MYSADAMLNEDPNSHEAVRDAMIFWHRNDVLPPNPPNGVHINGPSLEVQYGQDDVPRGHLRFARGQFELTHTTDGNGVFQPLNQYNHEGVSRTWATYHSALGSGNVTGDQVSVSRMIILTSECARSELVFNAIQWLLGHPADDLTLDQWNGLHHAFTTYGHTAAFRGFEIHAGGVPWSTLRAADYIRYIESDGWNGDVQLIRNRINEAHEYGNRL